MTDDVPVSTEIQVDDETRAALLLFNERVEATAAAERGKKRIAKAERAKADAAKAVRQLNNDPDATAEQKAEAEAVYKEASEQFLVVQANPLAGDQKKPAAPKDQAASAASSDEADATLSTDTDSTEPAEVSADDDPVKPEASSETE